MLLIFSIALFCADTKQAQVLSSVGSREGCQVWPSGSPSGPPPTWAVDVASGVTEPLKGAGVVCHLVWPPWQDLKYLPSAQPFVLHGMFFTFLVSSSIC